MNCIICEKTADEVGSHYVPASLIKNCVGKRYWEESFEIDVENSEINTFYGRNNLANPSEERKESHYTKDNILCKICEKKLADLEGKFSTEFLAKFRNEKFIGNFNSYVLATGFEIYEPRRIDNTTVLTYFYSIIFRYCSVLLIFEKTELLTPKELENIRIFLFNTFYNEEGNHSIAGYNLVIILTKYSLKGSTISSSTDFSNPYVFFFCDAVVQLFTEEPDSRAKFLFGNCFNSIQDLQSKIIVGPDSFFQSLSEKMNEKLAKAFMEEAINNFCKMNGKSFAENRIELNVLSAYYASKEEFMDFNPLILAIQEMKRKYN